MIALPNPLKYVRHYKVPERQTSRVTLLNSSILVTIWLSNSSSPQYWLTIYEAKITFIEDRMLEIKLPTPGLSVHS